MLFNVKIKQLTGPVFPDGAGDGDDSAAAPLSSSLMAAYTSLLPAVHTCDEYSTIDTTLQ